METKTSARLYSLLSNPRIYDLVQSLVGGGRDGRRNDFADRYVRARRGDRIVDVGCGTAQILSFLPEGIEYWGYDVSPRYIAAAQRRFGDRGCFVCRHLLVEELDSLPPFDIMLASGLIHHLDDREAGELFSLGRRALKPGGRLVSIDPCLTADQDPLARLLVKHDRGKFVRTPEQYRALASAHFTGVEGSVSHRSFLPYTHWMMECRT